MNILEIKKLDNAVTMKKDQDNVTCRIGSNILLTRKFDKDQTFTHVAIIEFGPNEIQGMEYAISGFFLLSSE